MKPFEIINNFAHDLSTGLWTSTLIVMYILREQGHAKPLLAAELGDMMHLFFWLGVASLATILGTGGIRVLYYRPATDGSERVKKGLLIAKHLLFAVVFSGGTFLAYRWTFQ